MSAKPQIARARTLARKWVKNKNILGRVLNIDSSFHEPRIYSWNFRNRKWLCVLAHTNRITANKLLGKLSSQFNIAMLLGDFNLTIENGIVDGFTSCFHLKICFKD